ncbi:PTS sugar transporter subunit IIB [[Eubacterium] hominis]|uniref:PTS sugar transporter subunit IIB n=1 Tax=[Eubacterium] hominis TaxID=2764325 RepID=UPI0022E8B539
MKKILLVCSEGMSTSFMTMKMNEIAKEKKVDVYVYAKSESMIEDELDQVDCILLGPQIAYLESKIKDRVNGKVPVESISALDFGRMNTLAILKQAIRLLKNK